MANSGCEALPFGGPSSASLAASTTHGQLPSALVRVPELRVRAIEIRTEDDGSTSVLLRLRSTVMNPSDSCADLRDGHLTAKLGWSQFKRLPDAKYLLEHLGTDPVELRDYLKELEAKSKDMSEEERFF